ncbi:MAG: RnfABCDGE type electron transport complex subunit B [Nevskia sp.]|nr:RnfABCDGE type electron transport complex subunit B [Nevskia sp.]
MTAAAALAARIDTLLPQTQCARCGYDGCQPYAEAIAAGTAQINQCPPGGQATIEALATLLGRAPLPLNPANGAEPTAELVAVIDEQLCIGCYKCIQACPVDAIVGAPKRMHTVIAAECSGCELCLPPCPVDCIALQPRPPAQPASAIQAPLWRRRHQARRLRLAREQEARLEVRRRRTPSLREQAQAFDITAAIERARARRKKPSGNAS